jgi:hypothetical protein
MGVPQKLARVMAFECFDELVKELNERCDRLIAQVQRQAYDGQIIGFHHFDLCSACFLGGGAFGSALRGSLLRFLESITIAGDGKDPQQPGLRELEGSQSHCLSPAADLHRCHRSGRSRSAGGVRQHSLGREVSNHRSVLAQSVGERHSVLRVPAGSAASDLYDG